MNRVYAAVVVIFLGTIGCAIAPYYLPEGDGGVSLEWEHGFGTTPAGGGGNASDSGNGSGGGGDGGDGGDGDGGDGGGTPE
ncbi:MAG: hypothetical protein KDI68_09760 [Gammaproteobacteria bacterium]|nr:hypothetical protein [Gammaproteobacteria bacterium]